MIFVDSNVFLIDLRYPRDANAATNKRFLESLKGRNDGCTSIVNLLEIMGILSFNLNARQLKTLFKLFGDRYGVTILPNAEADSHTPCWTVGLLVQRITRRLSLGDAMILEHAETPAFRVETIVTWDAAHFMEGTTLPVQTPAQFLEGEADRSG